MNIEIFCAQYVNLMTGLVLKVCRFIRYTGGNIMLDTLLVVYLLTICTPHTTLFG